MKGFGGIGLFGEDFAARADDKGAAGKGLFGAGGGDVAVVIAGDAEDAVFLAAGAEGRAGPGGPTGAIDGGRVRGEGE